jgi:hypothetical protein
MLYQCPRPKYFYIRAKTHQLVFELKIQDHFDAEDLSIVLGFKQRLPMMQRLGDHIGRIIMSIQNTTSQSRWAGVLVTPIPTPTPHRSKRVPPRLVSKKITPGPSAYSRQFLIAPVLNKLPPALGRYRHLQCPRFCIGLKMAPSLICYQINKPHG